MNNKDRAWATVCLKNIEYNFLQIKKYTGKKVMCIIKADGYGHGSLQVAQTLERVSADYFGVATLKEAIKLRQSGVYAKILLLGFFEERYIADIIENNITVTVYDYETAQNISKTAKKLDKTVNIHIKIDTGMSRLGFSLLDEAKALDDIVKISKLDGVFIEGIFTHFMVADNPQKKHETYAQANKFNHFIALLEKENINIEIKHTSASGAILQYPDLNFDMVRAGIILYGYPPDEKISKTIDLKPAMTLTSKIAQVKDIKANDGVSYGMNFVAPHDMKIAIITIGYADGYLRANSNKAYFLINGQKAQILGNICMDMCMVDVSNIEGVNKGDDAIIFGYSNDKFLSAEEVAKFANTITYEILCSISKRVPRIYTLD